MTELDRRHYFFTQEEFALCCTAAGIERVCAFRQRQQKSFSQAEAIETAFDMVRRSLLRIEDGQFILMKDLSDCFRVIRESERVILADRGFGPCGLLYGDGEMFVSMRQGERAQDYVCLSQYRREELDVWLSDLSLLSADGIADDLLEIAELGLLPELDDRGLADYLTRCLGPGAGEEPTTPFPEGIAFFIEGRRISDQRLLGRAFLVRQALFDRLMAWSGSGDVDRLCSAGALTQFIENLWK